MRIRIQLFTQMRVRFQLPKLMRNRIRNPASKLTDVSVVLRWSLGCVDWRLDPGILGLEQETGFALDFHMEKFVDTTAHLDLLLGQLHPRVVHLDLNP
jgi:hypothetical protein